MFRHLHDNWYQCDVCGAQRRSPVDLARVRCRCGGYAARPLQTVVAPPESGNNEPCGGPCGNRVVKLFETAWNFTSAIAYWAARGFKTTTQAQYDERRAICRSGSASRCPSGKLVVTLGMIERCGECKCVIALKAGLIQNPGKSDCPLGHWPAISQPPEPEPEPEPPTRIVRPTPPSEKPVEDKSRKLLFCITKGLGDSMCFRSALMHLRAQRPECDVDVRTHPWHTSIFDGLCNRVLTNDPPPGLEEYDSIHTPSYFRPKFCVFDAPCNTTQRFVIESCRLKPTAELSVYGTLKPSAEEVASASEVLQRLSGTPLVSGRYRVVLIHQSGRSFPTSKNPKPEVWHAAINHVRELGYSVMAVNFDGNSPAVHDGSAHSLDLTNYCQPQHGTSLAAIIEQVALFIGVDSGPLHVAGACSTPTIGVWTRHHPCHSYNLADNVTHLVPQNHHDFLPRANRDAGVSAFQSLYKYRIYDDLALSLAELAEEQLSKAGPRSYFAPKFGANLGD